MIQTATLTTKAGLILESIPCIQFKLDSVNSVAVFGMDFTDQEGTIELASVQITSEMLGKLSEVQKDLQDKVIQSLRIQGWDFLKYPNPELILLTKVQ